MDLHTLIEALALGAVEGLTEFIPVSSTGHLILFGHLFGFDGPPGRVFEIVIQLGAILAVCLVYRKRLIDTLLGLGRDVSARRFAVNVFIAFLPAVVAGVLLHGFIKSVLFSPYVVCVSLIVGGFAILFIERNFTSDRVSDIDSIDWKLALQIGLCQILAMIPGVSRSGATIMGARVLGLNRAAATEFSFFLAIPTMLAATAYDAYKNAGALSGDNWLLIGLGFAMAFITAALVVSKLVSFVSRNGFGIFAWYRIGLGSLMLALLLLVK
ncbi:MAG: undecaprenyl-diphosphate phosphatase [Alphaproteobacteria bacterium]|jgi:undecaprenyl-diphosphatase|nr:undecaprenyl-diphosphate phosphatase [Alphaproteobacteria bacterium]